MSPVRETLSTRLVLFTRRCPYVTELLLRRIFKWTETVRQVMSLEDGAQPFLNATNCKVFWGSFQTPGVGWFGERPTTKYSTGHRLGAVFQNASLGSGRGTETQRREREWRPVSDVWEGTVTIQEVFIRPIKTIAGSLRFWVKIMIKGKMKAKPPKEHVSSVEEEGGQFG